MLLIFLIVCLLSHFRHVWLFVIPRTLICQLPCPWNSSGKDNLSGLPFPLPGDLRDLRSNPCLLCLLHCQAGSLPLTPPGKPQHFFFLFFFFFKFLFYFTILYWFCHASTWIPHRCTWVPNPEPPSHLHPHTICLQPLWRAVWRFLKKLEIELPYDPAIPLLGIHTEETRTERDTCTPVFFAAAKSL